MRNILRLLSSFIAPVLLCFVLPYFLIRFEHRITGYSMFATSILLWVIGLVLCASGLGLAIVTIRMFILIGDGTIMPWDPTRGLIVASLYSRVRNPLILSLFILLIGEAILFVSYGIALVAILFFVINTIYFIYSEEPGLERRFGEEYIEYKKNVPRWIPRLKPWRPV